MLPYIYLFGREIPMYGVMFITAAAAAIGSAMLRARRTGAHPQDVLFMSLYAFVGAIIGAKALYLVTILNQVPRLFEAYGWAAFLYLAQGGMVFYGGLIGGGAAAFAYLRRYKVPPAPVIDAVTPFLPLAHFVGRVGCFFAGCCYGIPVSWGVIFANSPVAPHDEALLPIQLIEAGVNLIIMSVLLAMSGAERFRGRLVGYYVIMYSSARFVLEFFRYDAERGLLGPLSTSQLISAALLGAGLVFAARARKNSRF